MRRWTPNREGRFAVTVPHIKHDVEVVLVGDELLRGERRDAHLPYIARACARHGVRVHAAHTVGDDVAKIAEAVRSRLPHTRALVVTGGLGPTDDDTTREGVAEALDAVLEFHEDEWRRIEAFFATRGRTATEANRRQAHFPRGAEIIVNERGTASGFCAAVGDTLVFVLPGPPGELQPMVESFVLARLESLFARPRLRVETFRTIGVGESQLVEAVGADAWRVDAYSISWLPNVAGVDVVLTQKPGADAAQLDVEAARLQARLEEVLGTKLYERGERALAQVAGDLLKARGETLAAAESLTGGTIGRLVTETAGSSEYFRAGVVAYSNESKVDLLGVRGETIEQYGAVSEEACTEMAHGIRRRAKATYGIATTGIAGPGGATPHKPVGLTFIGVAWEGGSQVRRVIYPGDRGAIRDRAAHGALWLLYDHLRRRG
jgi:nicotinamide-nucleotide amidase